MGVRSSRLAVLASVCLASVTFTGAASAAGVDITVVEGQAFTKTVDDSTCPPSTISWGDGGSSAGSAAPNGIQGTHVYGEEGVYNGTVTYNCGRFPTTDNFQATVQDAPLTAGGRDVAGHTGEAVSAVTAHFSDGNPSAAAGDFSAQITWGDGAKTVGQVSAVAGGGGFDVSGTHTYNAEGGYAVSTSITDSGGSTAGASSAATISAPPPPPPPPAPPAGPAPGTASSSSTPLTARFRILPPSPCPETDVILDASASTGANGAPITNYVWKIVATLPTGRTVFDTQETTDPQLPYGFNYFVRFGAFRGQLTKPDKDGNPVVYDVYDYELLRPPTQVLLRVEQFDPATHTTLTARTVQAVTFTNADLPMQVAYATVGHWFPPGISAYDFIVNPGPRKGCPPITERTIFGSKAVRASVALASLTHSLTTITPGGLIRFQTKCGNAVRDCVALTNVVDAKRSRAHARAARAGRAPAALPHSLGTKTLVVPAGQTITVSVPLNRRGRALARAHRLRRVTILLASVGAEGSIVKTQRTVTLSPRG